MVLATISMALLAFAPANKLTVKHIVTGHGPKAVAGDLLSVEYTGKLTSGKVFDTSEQKPPFVFQLGKHEVISGWDAGLLGCRVGDVLSLTIPPKMGYGDKGAGADIPPNSTLVFKIKVLGIERTTGNPKVTITELKKGSGKTATKGATVAILYKGTFLNGLKFDSTDDHGGKPFEFQVGVGQVVKGFDEAILGMKVGGKRKVVIPSALAYGERGAGGAVPPNSTLVFEITLKSVS